MNGYLQVILLSLLYLHINSQYKNSYKYQGPDYSKDIERTIKRYSRETNQAIGEIKQRVFERRIDKFRVATFFKKSEKLK